MKGGLMTDKMDLTVKMNPDKKDLYESFAQALRGDDKLAPFLPIVAVYGNSNNGIAFVK